MDLNSLLASRQNQRLATAEHIRHVVAVQTAKARIDTASPRSFSPTRYLRGKALRYHEDRRLQIQRDNHLLLSRLRRMRSPLPGNAPQPPRSLNLQVRVAEMKRINQDNSALLSVLTTVKPQLQRKEWAHFERDVSSSQHRKYRRLLRAVTPQFQAPLPRRQVRSPRPASCENCYTS